MVGQTHFDERPLAQCRECGVEGKIVSNVSRSTNIIDDDGDDSEKEMESDQTINLLARRHIALTGHFSVQKRVK